MKKYSKYILTFIICAFSLTGCMTEEAASDVDLAMAGAKNASVNAFPDTYDDAEADVYISDGKQPAEEDVDEYNEKSTVTTVSASESNDPIATVTNTPIPADTTSDDSVNTTPANLNDPIPTMTYASVNSAGEYEYTVQNNTQYEWGYGLEPYFDKYDEEQKVWLPVEPITEVTVIEIYCILPPGGSSTYTLPMDQYYGDLSAGSYRVGLLMRNHKTEMAEMVWYEFSVGIDESYWRD